MSLTSIKKKAIREAVLLSLLEGAKDLSALTTDIKVVGTTVLHDLKRLEDSKLTTKVGGVYSLTSLGILEAQSLREYVTSVETINAYRHFWLTHNITSLPSVLMANIGALSGSTLLEATATNINLVHLSFVNSLNSAKTVNAISPIYHPDYANAFRRLLESGVKIQLIATTEVIKKIEQEIPEVLDKYTPTGDFRVFVKENLGVAIAITDKDYTMGLFDLHGRYDANVNLIGDGSEGLLWHSQLFNLTLLESIPYVYQKKL
jgi:predicted transcriptional regulator